MGKFNLNDEDFEKVKAEAKELYEKISDVWCPYFGEKIQFNAKGWRHLIFKDDRQARSREDQYARLKLFHLVPEVLHKSRTLQGILQKKCFEEIKSTGRWRKEMKDVTFYEFVAVLDSVRLKIVIKEVIGGQKHFWSVIPFWGIDKEMKRRILHGGDPEID